MENSDDPPDDTRLAIDSFTGTMRDLNRIDAFEDGPGSPKYIAMIKQFAEAPEGVRERTLANCQRGHAEKIRAELATLGIGKGKKNLHGK